MSVGHDDPAGRGRALLGAGVQPADRRFGRDRLVRQRRRACCCPITRNGPPARPSCWSSASSTACRCSGAARASSPRASARAGTTGRDGQMRRWQLRPWGVDRSACGQLALRPGCAVTAARGATLSRPWLRSRSPADRRAGAGEAPGGGHLQRAGRCRRAGRRRCGAGREPGRTRRRRARLPARTEPCPPVSPAHDWWSATDSASKAGSSGWCVRAAIGVGSSSPPTAWHPWPRRTVERGDREAGRARARGGIRTPLDPHAWQSVPNMKRYVANIADALCEVAPASCGYLPRQCRRATRAAGRARSRNTRRALPAFRPSGAR